MYCESPDSLLFCSYYCESGDSQYIHRNMNYHIISVRRKFRPTETESN